MVFSIEKEDLPEIKKFIEDKLSGFLVSNLTDFNHCLFIVQAIIDKINEIEKTFDEE